MGMPKLTGFMIALVLVCLFAGFFIFTTTSISTSYGVDYDNTTLTKYSSEMDYLNKLTQNITTDLNIDERAGLYDIIGGYFSAGYKSLYAAAKSFNLFQKMATDVFDDGNLGFKDEGINNIGSMLSVALIAIVIILLFIGVIMSVLVKREKL